MEVDSKKDLAEGVVSERILFNNSRGLYLVGDFYPAASDKVVIMSHGMGGDRHEGGKFDELAALLQASGINILKYDFTGSGESQDTIITPTNEKDDLQSALELMKRKGFKDIGLLGFSFGGYISLSSYHEREIKTLVLWSPVTNRMTDPESYYGDEGVRELRGKGFITRIREGVRPRILIGNDVFNEWHAINQQELLSRIKCPILILHGSEDTRIPLSDSQSAINYLPSQSKLEVIEGAGHTYDGCTEKVVESSLDWFKKQLLAA